MKKPKMPIRRKLLILTAALSAALALSAFFVSYRMFTEKSEEDAVARCKAAAEGADEAINAEYEGFVSVCVQKMGAVYYENRDLLESVADPERSFASYEEREKFYKDLTSEIFPPEGAFGLSYQTLVFTQNYKWLVRNMELLKSTESLDAGYIFFYDAERDNAVFLADTTSDGSLSYHFPCSIEKPGEKLKEFLASGQETGSFFENGAWSSVKRIKDTDGGESGDCAYIIYSQTNARFAESRKWFALTTLFIMLGAAAVFAVFYLFFADILIVRSVKRLTRAAAEFTENIENGGSPEPVPVNLKTSDELSTLSEKLDSMQYAIADYAKSLTEKTAAEEKMRAELELASLIQSEALPKQRLVHCGVSVSPFLRPAKEVGGDFFDYFPLDEDRLFFYISDVSGKGVPAALFMMRAKEMIKAGARSHGDLASLVRRLNNELCAGNAESLFITAFFGIINVRTGETEYLRAGQEQPFLRRAGEVKKIAEESNFLIGSFENMEYSSGSIKLLPGDSLLLYTDGLNEGINTAQEEFGYDRIAKAFANAGADALPEIYAGLCEFTAGAERFDDVTMLLLSVAEETVFALEDPGFESISRVIDGVCGPASRFGEEYAAELGIIIDELMNNCVSYAFENASGKPELCVTARFFPGETRLIISDNGTPFDPLRDAPEAPDLAEGELPVGGVGIKLVKNLCDGMEYSRRDGKNVLTVIKKAKQPENE